MVNTTVLLSEFLTLHGRGGYAAVRARWPEHEWPQDEPERAALLAKVAACPDRGGVLGTSLQPVGCCGGGELTACSAGKGKIPGRVTLSDCISCKSEQPSSITT